MPRPAVNPGSALWTRIECLVADARRGGIEVSIAGVLDAATALKNVDLTRRIDLHTMLSATLIKSARHQTVFDDLFDRHFPASVAATTAMTAMAAMTAPAEQPAPFDTAEALGRALEQEAGIDRRHLVEQLVDRHAGIDDDARTERYHLYRTLRAIDLTSILSAAIRRARENGVEIDRAALDARSDELRTMIAAEIRFRLTATERQPGRVADPFDVELARASATELEHIRESIRPLARRLAAQLRQRHRSASGRVDMRRTIHRSLSTGGVPIDVRHRRPVTRRPALFVLCDVSGSVADFSGFTLTLISGLAEELATTRTFAFVDAIDEISEVLTSTSGVIEPWQLLQSGRVIGDDGHSDYGAVLDSFWERYGRTGLTDRSTVVIVGDARGNHRPPRADIVEQIAARARRVYWLNPEPNDRWNTTDSTQAEYARHCSAVYEVRTLGQLATAVLEML